MKSVNHIIGFRVTRFTLAGAVNTAVNFAVLNLMFYGLHLNKIVSIIVATSCAIVVSFILNRNFVFVDKERPAGKLARFLLVSVLGVFLIQNTIYALGLALLHNHTSGLIDAVHHATGHGISSSLVEINLSNILASFVVMFWNYNGYRVFVFSGKRDGNDIIEDLVNEAA